MYELIIFPKKHDSDNILGLFQLLGRIRRITIFNWIKEYDRQCMRETEKLCSYLKIKSILPLVFNMLLKN